MDSVKLSLSEVENINVRKNKVKVDLKPIVTNINAVTVIKTGKLPGTDKDSIIFSTQVGEVYSISTGEINLILDLRDKVYNNHNVKLTGLELHPNFQTNGRFFLCYTNTLSANIVVEFKLGDINRPDVKMVRTLFAVDYLSNNIDSLCNISYDTEIDRLILCIGDGGIDGDPNNLSQDDNKPQGKLISIDVNYNLNCSCDITSITNLDEIKRCHRSIYNIIGKGLQNPCSLLVGDVKYLIDRGKYTMDEINAFKEYGKNYGWRAWEGIYPSSSITSNSSTSNSSLCYSSFNSSAPSSTSSPSKINSLVITNPNEGLLIPNHHRPFTVIPLYTSIECEGSNKGRNNEKSNCNITGGSLYKLNTKYANSIDELNGCYIFCSKYSTSIRSGKYVFNKHGSIRYVNLDKHTNLESYINNIELQIMYDFKGRDHYYTTMGSNSDNSRLFLGVYGSNNMLNINKGTLFEIVKYNEPISRLDTSDMPELF